MGLKLNVKKGDVGTLPDGWSLKELGDVSDLDAGLSKPKIVFGSGCPVVTVQDLYEGETINVSNLKRVVVTEEEIHRYRLFKNDILIGNASVKRDGIGYSNRFDGSHEDVIFAKYAYRARNLRSILPIYLHYVLRGTSSRQWIISNSQTGTLTNLNKAATRAIPVLVPPLPEQAAITTTLSDIDALLNSLELLITKKLEIKQAVMQKLLTRQIRLPGFSREWEIKSLGELVNIQKGQLITGNTLEFGNVPVIAGGKQPAYFHKFANRFGKTITISASGASAGYVALHEQPIFASDCSTISEAPEYSLNFIFFQLLLNQNRIYKAQTGGAQPHIHAKDLNPIEIPIPDIEEQNAIAKILSDMDCELENLEARLNKTRKLKQGMMQELLTGKIRLI